MNRDRRQTDPHLHGHSTSNAAAAPPDDSDIFIDLDILSGSGTSNEDRVSLPHELQRPGNSSSRGRMESKPEEELMTMQRGLVQQERSFWQSSTAR